MQTSRKNKQRMWYSIPGDEVPVYERDTDGNILYETYTDSDGNTLYVLDEDGERIPKKTGGTEQGYEEPVMFLSGISGRITQALIEAYGINDTTMYAQIDYMKDEYPFKVGTLIWKRSEPSYIDGVIDQTSADYKVVAILDEYPNVYSCLLKRVLK